MVVVRAQDGLTKLRQTTSSGLTRTWYRGDDHQTYVKYARPLCLQGKKKIVCINSDRYGPLDVGTTVS